MAHWKPVCTKRGGSASRPPFICLLPRIRNAWQARLPRALASWEWSLQDLAATELMKWTNPPVVAATAQAFLATLAEAHAMVVPCMIDHLGIAHETAAVPTLASDRRGRASVAAGHLFPDQGDRSPGQNARAGSGAPRCCEMVRQRNGLAHDEPAALRAAAEEALGAARKSALFRARSSRGKRAHEIQRGPLAASPLPARAPAAPPCKRSITGTRDGAARVRVIALGGAFLETDQRLALGDSMQLEIRTGLRKIQSTAVVRNITPNGSRRGIRPHEAARPRAPAAPDQAAAQVNFTSTSTYMRVRVLRRF